MKIANDIRWLASGPALRPRPSSLTLPEKRAWLLHHSCPGQSNPQRRPEAVTNWSAVQVMGNDRRHRLSPAPQGNFELKRFQARDDLQLSCTPWKLLADACNSFVETLCQRQSKPIASKSITLRRNSLSCSSPPPLAPKIGYDKPPPKSPKPPTTPRISPPRRAALKPRLTSPAEEFGRPRQNPRT